jgi:hypothetical protein
MVVMMSVSFAELAMAVVPSVLNNAIKGAALAWRTIDRCAFMSTSQRCTPELSSERSTRSGPGRVGDRLMHLSGRSRRPKRASGLPDAFPYYLHIK